MSDQSGATIVKIEVDHGPGVTTWCRPPGAIRGGCAARAARRRRLGSSPRLNRGLPTDMTVEEDVLQHLRRELLPDEVRERRVTDLMDLRGSRAVVTGGGGAGLGQAIAHRLAGLGADVA